MIVKSVDVQGINEAVGLQKSKLFRDDYSDTFF